ncbi:TauD/TfdA family dioxygenase [Streptomyces cylindrosporus]|uniref:TauD/TfdA family dioxygenase n=1 Tax=Streptomyces cylindrosporus TaxID=2927583 RepID=A0ABS9YEM0_9ACTN|nr:TauD/TfdA family dioxygenase [Streptomyces cylindrosporus]MCI3275051.1 TauD/TfdA family dioxygenase [Streptomyces cylindrosporus]
MRITAYGTGTGLLVEPDTTVPLHDVTPATIKNLLPTAGVLLLRGFTHTDLAAFTSLVQRTSTSTTLDPAREFYSEVAQKVDSGTDALGLHTENGNNPFRPHLVWFYCAKAARTGSQTTVCDGHRVWDALSAAAREAFTAQDIVYARYVAEHQWKTMTHHLLDKTRPLEDITIEDLQNLLSTTPDTDIAAQPDGGITYAFRTPAAGPTLFGSRTAFANSLLGPSYNYEKPTITFADGSPLPDALLAEVESVTAGLTEEIDWRDGDVVVIDNTRVMHGRRAITDPNRTIFNALSYIEKK